MIVLPLVALAGLFPHQAAQEKQLPVKPPPVPTGVVPLPQGTPPTGPQAPVPPPIGSLPKSDAPIRISPDLRSVEAYIDNRAVTLQEAVAIALFTSRDFASAAASLQQAEGRAGQARTALYPTIGANGDITYYDRATTADLSALTGGTGSGSTGSSTAIPPLVITPQFNPVFTATFALPLDVFGSLRAAASQAQFTAVAARLDVNRVRNEVVYNVKSAFYDVLRAQAQVDVATDSLNNTLTRLNDANKNYGAGTTPRFDVITAQRDVASAQQDLINAQAQLSVNMASLKNTIGLSLKSRLRISDAGAVEYPPGVLPPTVPEGGTRTPQAPGGANPIKPPVVSPPVETAPPVAVGNVPLVVPTIKRVPGEVEDAFDFGPEFDGLVQEALHTRPDVLEGDARIAAALRGVQYARRSQLPSLNLSLTDTYTPNATGFTREDVKAITLGVTVPIYDGGLARERVKEARGIEASARIDRRTSTDQVQLDVQRAYIALVQARSRVAVANVGLAQAREAFRLARDRYNAGVSQQVGVSPQVELSNAQTALAQAESNGVNALYDFNAARAQLDRAVGRFSFTGAQPGYPTPPSDKTRGVKD